MAKKKKSRKSFKLTLFVAAVIAIVVFMAVSCPGERDHSAVMEERFEDVAYSYLGTTRNGLASLLVEPAVSKITSSCFVVDNHILYSVGRIVDPVNPDREPMTVSVGLLGHVFAPSADRIRKTIDESEEAKAIREIFKSLK